MGTGDYEAKLEELSGEAQLVKCRLEAIASLLEYEAESGAAHGSIRMLDILTGTASMIRETKDMLHPSY